MKVTNVKMKNGTGGMIRVTMENGQVYEDRINYPDISYCTESEVKQIVNRKVFTKQLENFELVR